MADHCGYVVKIKELRKHNNADRLKVATIFGNDTIVGDAIQKGDIGVYFPAGLQLSERFCEVNNLVRRKDENGNNVGGFLDPDKRNVKCIKIRGEHSDGLWLPVTCLMDFCPVENLRVGDTVDVINGEEICRKYVPRRNPNAGTGKRSSPKQAKVNFAPTFFEHVDTSQLAYNLGAFKNGDIVQLTLKMHGTSGRTGYLPLIRTKQTWLDKLLRRHGTDYFQYGYVTGTRRVVLSEDRRGGYYESDDFRHAMSQKFEGRLRQNETVYYEIVGFQGPGGAPIMAAADNTKASNLVFLNKYGPTTTFSYGCTQDHGYSDESPCCDVYVYRMTMVNGDGYVVEYSPDQIRDRCEQMGVHVVPEFERFIIPHNVNPGEYVLQRAELYFEGPDPVDPRHIREGVVARICNKSKFAVYKHKGFLFKQISGIAIEQLTDAQLNAMSQDMIEEL